MRFDGESTDKDIVSGPVFLLKLKQPAQNGNRRKTKAKVAKRCGPKECYFLKVAP